MGIFSLLIPFEKNKFVFFSNFRGLHNCDAGVAIAIPENASGHCNCDADRTVVVSCCTKRKPPHKIVS